MSNPYADLDEETVTITLTEHADAVRCAGRRQEGRAWEKRSVLCYRLIGKFGLEVMHGDSGPAAPLLMFDPENPDIVLVIMAAREGKITSAGQDRKNWEKQPESVDRLPSFRGRSLFVIQAQETRALMGTLPSQHRLFRGRMDGWKLLEVQGPFTGPRWQDSMDAEIERLVEDWLR